MTAPFHETFLDIDDLIGSDARFQTSRLSVCLNPQSLTVDVEPRRVVGGADGVGRHAGVGAAVGGDHVADVDVADDVVVHGHVLPDKVPAVTEGGSGQDSTQESVRES